MYDIATQFNNIGYSIYDFRDYLDNVIEEGIDIQYESRNDNVDSVRIMTIHKTTYGIHIFTFSNIFVIIFFC